MPLKANMNNWCKRANTRLHSQRHTKWSVPESRNRPLGEALTSHLRDSGTGDLRTTLWGTKSHRAGFGCTQCLLGVLNTRERTSKVWAKVLFLGPQATLVVVCTITLRCGYTGHMRQLPSLTLNFQEIMYLKIVFCYEMNPISVVL